VLFGCGSAGCGGCGGASSRAKVSVCPKLAARVNPHCARVHTLALLVLCSAPNSLPAAFSCAHSSLPDPPLCRRSARSQPSLHLTLFLPVRPTLCPCRFHAILLSGRSVHLLDKPGFSALAAPEGCVLVAETARNVVHLKREQQAEYARRVAAMAGAAGAVLVGGDRAISADTYSVGTVIDPKRLGKGPASAGPGAGASVSDSPASSAAAAAPLFSRDAAPFLGAIHGSAGGSAAAAGGDAAASGGGGVRRRVKNVTMSALAHAPLPHPAVASLLAAASASGGDTGSGVTAAARVAADVLVRAVRDGIAAHEVEGGDNPHPEALVFALLPAGGAAAAVKEAVLSALPLKPASHGEIAGSEAAGAAAAGSAAAAPSPAS
jgi:hypothetical protein